MREIKRVAVIGAGLMGSGIAAHVANAGIPVDLLDIVPGEGGGRNSLAERAMAALAKASPAPLMHDRAARLITPGNLEDHLDRLGKVDWICEAVVEDPRIKQDVYCLVDGVRKRGSVVTSNTSTIPLATLLKGLPKQFAADFAVTHFFNPPRYMRLLELVGGPETDPAAIAALRSFCDIRLGKEVVDARDTPGFIGNRIGIYWYYVAMSEAMALGLSVEEADAVVGPPMGIPKTGIFGLVDLTGIDLAPKVNATMLAMLPGDDAFCREFDPKGPLVSLFDRMIAEGYTGRKGKGGFYRMRREGPVRQLEARDFATGAYRPVVRPRLASVEAARSGGLRALVEHADRGGEYARRVLLRVLAYAARLVPDVAADACDVDRAMRSGYGWTYGPFEMIDQLGVGWLAEQLQDAAIELPALLASAKGRPIYRESGTRLEQMTASGDYQEVAVDPGAWRLADMKRGRKPVARNGSASLWDVGDGVACLELHSKMNAIDEGTMAMVRRAARIHEMGFKALIIGGDADNFSVGANVGVALFAANAAMWPLIEQKLRDGQDAYRALRDAPFPVIGAPSGMALGGGCEMMLHCDAVQAHAETYMGLVEVGVGLIPGWGGTKEMVLRAFANKRRPNGPMPAIQHAFETISLAKVSRSAADARDLLYLGDGDGITMNRSRVLADAKARALAMVDGYQPRVPGEVPLPGATARATIDIVVGEFVRQGKATAHDLAVARALAGIVSGGDTDITQSVGEEHLLALERTAFMSLVRQVPTLDRIEHMLDTGKPLRN
jgi:3-hydroxyacyl-CoA dehydrogenase